MKAKTALGKVEQVRDKPYLRLLLEERERETRMQSELNSAKPKGKGFTMLE